MSESNKPFETLRDGAIKATIWRNEGDKGFYSVEFGTYTDAEDNYKDTIKPGADLLKVSRLAVKAY